MKPGPKNLISLEIFDKIEQSPRSTSLTVVLLVLYVVTNYLVTTLL